ncbi:putative membrane protein [Chlamydia ibidis]|nr:putative membrane protein [Chlamydia ibidis]
MFARGTPAKRALTKALYAFTAQVFGILCLITGAILAAVYLHPLSILAILVLVPIYFVVRCLLTNQLRKLYIALDIFPSKNLIK